MQNIEKRVDELFFLTKLLVFFFCLTTVLACLFFVSNFQLNQEQVFSGFDVLASFAQIVIAGGVIVAYIQYKKSVEQHRLENLHNERTFVNYLIDRYDRSVSKLHFSCELQRIGKTEIDSVSTDGVYAITALLNLGQEYVHGKIQVRNIYISVDSLMALVNLTDQLMGLEKLHEESKTRIIDELSLFMESMCDLLQAVEKDGMPQVNKNEFFEKIICFVDKRLLGRYEAFKRSRKRV